MRPEDTRGEFDCNLFSNVNTHTRNSRKRLFILYICMFILRMRICQCCVYLFVALTWARDPSVLFVSAVGLVSRGRTGPQVAFAAGAVQVVQVDRSSASGEGAALARNTEGSTAAQLGARDVRIPEVPVVVTHRPPCPASPQLHASSTAVGSPGQSHGLVTWNVTQGLSALKGSVIFQIILFLN